MHLWALHTDSGRTQRLNLYFFGFFLLYDGRQVAGTAKDEKCCEDNAEIDEAVPPWQRERDAEIAVTDCLEPLDTWFISVDVANDFVQAVVSKVVGVNFFRIEFLHIWESFPVGRLSSKD